MGSKISLEARIMNCQSDYAGRSALVDAIVEVIEEHRRAGWEAAREAAMNLCRAEADRHEAASERAMERDELNTVAMTDHATDAAAALVEDIKRMPYPEKK
jgi:hypothetical protein